MTDKTTLDEEMLAKLASDIEDEKFKAVLSSLLGITTLSESDIIERLDSLWELGYSSAEKVFENISKYKIRMTKDIPSETSQMYFWAPEKNLKPVVGTLLDSGMFSVGKFSDMTPKELGGYWAKVEQSQFTFGDQL